MTTLADLSVGTEPNADPAPEPIHDGLYLAAEGPNSYSVEEIGEDSGSPSLEEPESAGESAHALGTVPD